MRLVGLALAATLAVACSGTVASAPACEAGTFLACTCETGQSGLQRCDDDGSRYEACACLGEVGVGGGAQSGSGGATSASSNATSSSVTGPSAVASSSSGGGLGGASSSTTSSGGSTSANVGGSGGGQGGGGGGSSASTGAGGGCIDDLSNIGAGDFHASFTLTTVQSGTVGIAEQRAVCAISMFWSIRLADGQLEVETDAGTSSQYTNLRSANSVNDGNPHVVVVARVSESLTIQIDGSSNGAAASSAPFDALAPLVIGSSPVCQPVDGTEPLVGTLTGFCLTTP